MLISELTEIYMVNKVTFEVLGRANPQLPSYA